MFGLTSVIRAFTAPSLLVAPLLGASPVWVILMSLAARLLIPVAAHFVYRLVSGGGQTREKRAIGAAAAAGSLINTIAYLGLMLLFYALSGLSATAVLGTIAGVGALNGSLEAVAAVLVCVPVVLAVKKAAQKRERQAE